MSITLACIDGHEEVRQTFKEHETEDARCWFCEKPYAWQAGAWFPGMGVSGKLAPWPRVQAVTAPAEVWDNPIAATWAGASALHAFWVAGEHQ